MKATKDDWKKFEINDNEMEFRLLDLGKVAPYIDNTYEFLETGRKHKLRRREFFGLEFVLVSNTIYEVELAIEVHFPDGTDENTTMKIKNNVPQMICQGFLHEYHMMDGEWSLRVEVKDRIYDSKGNEISVFGGLQEAFKIKCIAPEERLATEDDIHTMELMYSTTLNDDYKTFLKEHNGYNFNWCTHSDLKEQIKMVGEKELRKSAKLPSDKKDKEWIDEVSEFFGANTEKYIDLIPDTGQLYNHFYDVVLGRFFYPIGEDGNGNVMVQIASGAHKGKLGMLDHEAYFSIMAVIEPDEENPIEDLPFGDIATVAADKFINFCAETDFLNIFDESFDAYFTRRKAIVEEKKTLAKSDFQYMIPTEGDSNPEVDALMSMSFDEVEIKKMGSYAKTNDEYTLTEKGKKVKHNPSEFVGIQFKIKSSKDALQLAKCTVTDPNGNAMNSDIMVKPNALTTVAVPGTEKGEYTFKVKFPDNMILETLKQKIKVK